MKHSEIKDLAHGTIFDSGEDYKYGYWVAVRGGIPDWAIYSIRTDDKNIYRCINRSEINNYIKESGNKVWKRDAIYLVRADDEMASWYRE